MERNLERYARQIMLSTIDIDGQEKIFKAKVCIVGMGGLGCPASQQLVAMGIGYLRIIDRDIVSITDLHRQYLYNPEDRGKMKVEVAFERLKTFNPEVEIDPRPVAITEYNVEDEIKGVDLVLDCTDSIKARYLVNRACLKLGIPYIYGAAIENQGSAFTVLPGKTACLECIYPGLKDEDLPKCAVVGVHPSVLSIIASIQVGEAIRIITGKMPNLANKMLLVDFNSLSFDILNLNRSEQCPACSNYPSVELIKYATKYEIGCAREEHGIFYLYPPDKVNINLAELYQKLNNKGYKGLSKNKFSISFEPEEDIKMSISKEGFCVAQVSFKLAAQEGIESKLMEIYKEVLY
jgi:molybdopterin/thiamine biosynthesis adenylyltransferase